MKLLILGSGKKDKGSQLEALTRKILEYKRYKNIVVNEIGAGGHEVDVRAEFLLPTVGEPVTTPSICECKAHERPLNTNDWLKFLGKIQLEDALTQKQHIGCLVALGGVNGNVSGSYRSLKEHRSTVQLIQAEDLGRIIKDVFDILSSSEVMSRVRSLTKRVPVHLSPCYRDGCVYWLIEFEDNDFTFVAARGDQIEAGRAKELTKLSEKQVSGVFVDLQAEELAENRRRLVEAAAIRALLVEGGTSNRSELLEKVCGEDSEPPIQAEELMGALQRLCDEKIAAEGQPAGAVQLQSSDRPKLLRGILTRPLKAEALATDAYQGLFDDELVCDILDIQGHVPAEDSIRREVLKIVRLSPNALLWALTPQPFIVQHREEDAGDQQARVDENDLSFLRSNLVSLMCEDFNQQGLALYYFSYLNLRELESSLAVTMKGRDSIFLCSEVRDRHAIGELVPKLGGGLVQIRLMADAPEPWDSSKPEAELAKSVDEHQDSSDDDLSG